MKKNSTSKIALGGICLALTIICIFAASIVPGIELTLFAISSLFTAVMIIETGPKGGAILYIAAVILGLLIVPNKLGMIPYAFLFGYYGIVKMYLEKIPAKWMQLCSKAIFFAALLCVGLLGFKELLLGSIHLPNYPVAILILGGVLMLMLYDFVFSFLIDFYFRRIKGKGLNNIKLG